MPAGPRELFAYWLKSQPATPVVVGASPRAGLGLLRAACAAAVSEGRQYALPDDVKLVAEPSLGHRLVSHPTANLAGVTPAATVAEIVQRVPVPVSADR